MKACLINTIYFFIINICSIATALAAVVTYDEAISGDLDADRGNPVFNFDIGLNTISGTSNWLNNDPPDRDSFGFIVPIDTAITSITYEFDNLIYTDEYIMEVSLGIADTPTPSTLIGQDNVNVLCLDPCRSSNVDISPVSLFDGVLPLVSGTYFWGQGFGKGGSGAQWDYTVSFEVSAVPIPPALYLFGTGLIGLIVVARRKKA